MEEQKKLVEDTKALKKYQEEPTPLEDILKIPMLTREDMRKEALPIENKEFMIGNTKVVFQDIFTNGISYLNLMFDICRVPVELLPYVGVLKYVLGMVDTKNYSYGDFFNEVNMNTGGFGVSFNTYTDVNMRGKYSAFMEVKAKVLYEKQDYVFQMIYEMLLSSNLDYYKRLY